MCHEFYSVSVVLLFQGVIGTYPVDCASNQ